ncbi:MAG: M56 family metallopeptidase [Gemmatimonadaceae bacterium]|nr:M56 family metallopeptidase [Gemmatimonadaceae bacterium]
MLTALELWWSGDFVPLILSLLLVTVTIGTAWLVVVSVVSWCMRRAAAETRAALWAAGMIGLLMLPIGRTWFPPVSVPTSSRVWQAWHALVPVTTESSTPRSTDQVGAAIGAISGDATVHVTASPPTDRRDLTVTVDAPSAASVAPRRAVMTPDPRWRTTATALVVVWLLGALTMTIRFVRGTNSARRLWRSASRSFDGPQWTLMQEVCEAVGVQRPVSLRLVDGAQIPMTVGIIHPEVLLPASSLMWHPDRLRMVLQHELGHIARYDLAFATVAQVVVIGCWWHPLVWYAMRAMEREREHACDDVVLRSGVAPVRYADELLSVVRELRNPTPSAFATLAMARSSDIESRLKALLNPTATRHRLSRPALVAMSTAAVLLLPLGALVPVQAKTPTPRMPRPSSIAQPSASIASSTPPSPPAPSPPPLTPPVVSAQANVAPQNDRKVLDLGKPCEAVKPGSSSITRSRSDDEFDDYTRKDDTGCLRVSRTGRVVIPSDDTPDVLEKEGRLVIEDAVGRELRRVVFTRRDNRVSRVVTRNGTPVPDGPTPSWVDAMLLSAYRETGLGADERVPRILGDGGVSALLEEIALIRTEETRVRYFELGLQAWTVPGADRVRLAQAASAFADKVGSRGDRARIHAAIQQRGRP